MVRWRPRRRRHSVLTHDEGVDPPLPQHYLGGGCRRRDLVLLAQSMAGVAVLRVVLPALYSHCLDVDVIVAEVLTAGGLDDNLQPCLCAADAEELDKLSSAVGYLKLRD